MGIIKSMNSECMYEQIFVSLDWVIDSILLIIIIIIRKEKAKQQSQEKKSMLLRIMKSKDLK